MGIASPYSYPHNWLKCNFHTHATLSDGRLSPEETIALYRDGNYDCLAITDHRKYWRPERESEGRMLLVAGQECHVCDAAGRGTSAHVVSLAASRHVADRASMQEIIDDVNAAGGLAIVAHPRWSWMTYEDFNALRDYAAFEAWNSSCIENGRAGSADYWDLRLAHGGPVWGVAVDDMHFADHHFGLGWTMVNAERTVPAILDALRRGDFYATSGPRIETIRVDGGTVRLHTSSARCVRFLGDGGDILKWVDGENVRVAEYVLSGNESYVRAEVVAHDGSVAWTNPFMIEP